MQPREHIFLTAAPKSSDEQASTTGVPRDSRLMIRTGQLLTHIPQPVHFTWSTNGLPVVDHVKCTGCGMCVKSCPVRIISLLSLGTPVVLACSSLDFGAAVKKMCSRGCISCQIC